MAKRIASSSVNWSLIHEHAPATDLASVQAFKTRSDQFLRRVAAGPAELPKIDWAYYKSKIAKPGMVETFQKGYESVNIPYPNDQGLLSKVDDQLVKTKSEYKVFIENTKKEINSSQEKLKKLEEVLKYSEMNLEEFFVASPQTAIDHDNPKLWPHNTPIPKSAASSH